MFIGLDIKDVSYRCDTAILSFYSGKTLRYIHITPERWALLDGNTTIFYSQIEEKYFRFTCSEEACDSTAICEQLPCYKVFRERPERFDDFELLVIQLSLFHLNKKPYHVDTAAVYDSYTIAIGRSFKEAMDITRKEDDVFHDTLRKDYWPSIFGGMVTNTVDTKVLSNCRAIYKEKRPRA